MKLESMRKCLARRLALFNKVSPVGSWPISAGHRVVAAEHPNPAKLIPTFQEL
jgi:hypothetical protein